MGLLAARGQFKKTAFAAKFELRPTKMPLAPIYRSQWRFLQPELPSGFKLEQDLQTELDNARCTQSEYAGS